MEMAPGELREVFVHIPFIVPSRCSWSRTSFVHMDVCFQFYWHLNECNSSLKRTSRFLLKPQFCFNERKVRRLYAPQDPPEHPCNHASANPRRQDSPVRAKPISLGNVPSTVSASRFPSFHLPFCERAGCRDTTTH